MGSEKLANGSVRYSCFSRFLSLAVWFDVLRASGYVWEREYRRRSMIQWFCLVFTLHPMLTTACLTTSCVWRAGARFPKAFNKAVGLQRWMVSLPCKFIKRIAASDAARDRVFFCFVYKAQSGSKDHSYSLARLYGMLLFKRLVAIGFE